MKKKYKILICSMICFALCFGMSITSYAGFYTAWEGDLDSDFDIDSSYSSSYPYFSSSYLSSYALSNALPNDFTGVNQSLFQTSAYALSGYFTDLANPTDFYTSFSTSIDVSELPLVLCGRRGSGSNLARSLVWHRIESTSFVSIVDNWLCSTEPFSVYSIYNRDGINDGSTLNSFCIKTDVDSAGTNGYYWFPLNSFFINGIVNASDFALMFTDFPIYMSTTSGDSGFTTYTDFSFVADNINYNYLLLDEIINDPQAPVTPSDNMWDEAKNYLNFRMTSYFLWDSDTKKFYHNMDFQWNENMLLNPDYYYLNCYYYITYKDSTMPAAVNYQYSPIVRNLLDMAYYRKSEIGKVPSRYSLGLFPSEFVDQNENTWLSAYLSTIHRVVGTDTQYININDFWDNGAQIWDWGTDFLWSSGRKLQYTKPIIGDDIEVFTIHCIVNVGRSADPIGASGQQDFISGSYTAYHDCLSGKTTITSTENATNLYPPEEGQNPSQIAKDQETGGTTISGGNHANAYGGNATVNINTDPMARWSPDVIKSIKDTFDFIQNQLSEYDDNNFMSFMVQSYKLLPDALWDLIILAGGVITGFAVVRFIRNK